MILPFGVKVESDFQGDFILFLGLLVMGILLVYLTNKPKYTAVTGIKSNWPKLLLLIRIIAIFILLLLIFDPQISIERSRALPKRVAVVIDQSRSMSTSWQGDVETLRRAVAEFVEASASNYDIDLWSMDGEILEEVPEAFDKELSLFAWSPVRDTDQDNNNIYRALFLVSDGQLNRGKSPLDLPWLKNLAVYTILPLEPKTNRLLRVVSLDYLYDEATDDELIVKIGIQQTGNIGKIVSLRVKNESGQIIGEQSLGLNTGFSEINIPLRLSRSQSHELTVDLSLQNGELNSSHQLTIDEINPLKNVLLVSDSVNELHRFLILAFPDSVYNVQQVLGTKIKSGGSDPIAVAADQLDLIVINQPGESGPNTQVHNNIYKAIENNCPLIVFYDGSSPLNEAWSGLLGIKQYRRDEVTEDLSAYWLPSAVDHPFSLGLKGMGYSSAEMINYPPLRRGTFSISAPGSDILGLGSGSGRGIALSISDHPPMAVFRGGNFWKWFFHPQAKLSFQNFWNYLNSYLKDIADFEPVSLSLPTIQSTSGGLVPITVSVNDLNNSKISNAELRVWQQDDTGHQEFLDLTRNSDGSYSTRLLSQRPGNIMVIAEARRFGELWGRDTSRIELKVFNEEDQSTGINEVLLARIAKRSGGHIVEAEKAELPIIPVSYYTQNSSFHFKGIRSQGIFVMLLTLLILEWVIRRRNGLL